MSSHAQTPSDREARWRTYGRSEMEKEVEHLRKYLPNAEITQHAEQFAQVLADEFRMKYGNKD